MGIKVISCFDGISCGMVALERAGINVEQYVAYEIDKYAIEISSKNYPKIKHCGDVTVADFTQYKGFDLLIGGSPCQNFSFAGTMKGMTTKENIEITELEQYLKLKEKRLEFEGYSYLFWEYVRSLKETKPKYFLLENVKMSEKWKNIITKTLGVEPIMIDSGLLSAQTRERYYWTNIPNVTQPKDKNIYIDDIIQNDIEHTFLPKTRLEYTNYDRTKVDKKIHKSTATQIGNSRSFGNSVRSNGKAFTLRKVTPNGIIDENYNIREFTPIEVERLQTLPDNYTLIDGIKKRERYEACGNGWTVDVIAHILKGILNT